ncbi:mitochondrial fission ELM1 family protein [Oecophyllibacter saccharovorans]|uniref:mitochondrial fission ELM1 family protein n=1 Tax=Oecophyllibacter saccharovorans TaxID=2558360 RepID=UPI0011669693|nr:mitochondrial fission ELM1 family protein [Oecophyllibacter saccharovorans]TPW34646.1 hypothetical protein E3203_03585 [Oecophyllibacter saccharovorans]
MTAPPGWRKHALIVAEDFAGMHAQGRGLAERAAMSWSFHAVPQRLKFRLPLHWLRAQSRRKKADGFRFDPVPDPDLVISIGGRGGDLGRQIGRACGVPVVQIQDPRRHRQDFSLVIANAHDAVKGDNVIEVRTALHDMTPARLAAAREKWEARLRVGEEKLLGVLLGGTNGRYRFGEPEAQALGRHIRVFLERTGMGCALVPSRRTSPQALRVMVAELSGTKCRVWQGQGADNPYVGVLGCADMLAVTVDSVSMISEAVATTAPVGLLALPGRSRRLSAFAATLKGLGRVQDFCGKNFENMSFSTVAHERVDDTSLAAREMCRRLFGAGFS